MKMTSIAAICMTFLLSACAESKDCAPPPPSISFQLQDKTGSDVSAKLANRVSVFYVDGGQTKSENVTTAVDAVQNRTMFFSYFPASAMAGVSDFTLRLDDGRAYPINVVLNPRQNDCSSPTIKQIKFNGQVVDPNRSLQPVTYFFTVE